jgi:hypothetical protein
MVIGAAKQDRAERWRERPTRDEPGAIRAQLHQSVRGDQLFIALAEARLALFLGAEELIELERAFRGAAERFGRHAREPFLSALAAELGEQRQHDAYSPLRSTTTRVSAAVTRVLPSPSPCMMRGVYRTFAVAGRTTSCTAARAVPA